MVRRFAVHSVSLATLLLVALERRLELGGHRRVGANLVIGAPAPTASSYGLTLAHLGLGLSFYLR